MSPLALLLLAAAPDSALLVTAEAFEQLPLPSRPSAVAVWPFDREIELTATAGLPSLKRALEKSRLCPTVRVTPTGLRLRCATGRLAAHLVETRRGEPALELWSLRALPWADVPALRFLASPAAVQLGDDCPGSTDVGRAECLLASGEVARARPLLEASLAGPQGAWAALRLGDLALAEDAPLAALEHWARAGTSGVAGALAAVRRCELSGCTGPAAQPDLYRADRLPEPARTEVELRELRRLALEGDPAGAALKLRARLASASRSNPCTAWAELCRAVTVGALRSADPESQAVGLELFVFLQRLGGAADAALTRHAADAALHLGAPRYAANLLASVTATVPPVELAEHLARLSALYRAAKDELRAGVVRDYAAARGLSPRHTPLPRAAAPADDVVARMEALARDAAGEVALADAAAATGRARLPGEAPKR